MVDQNVNVRIMLKCIYIRGMEVFSWIGKLVFEIEEGE